MRKDNSGPAFPSDQPIFMVPVDMPQEWKDKCASVAAKMEGMSLRDWFAGMAISGVVIHLRSGADCESLASDAFKVADAMLKERDK